MVFSTPLYLKPWNWNTAIRVRRGSCLFIPVPWASRGRLYFDPGGGPPLIQQTLCHIQQTPLSSLVVCESNLEENFETSGTVVIHSALTCKGIQNNPMRHLQVLHTVYVFRVCLNFVLGLFITFAFTYFIWAKKSWPSGFKVSKRWLLWQLMPSQCKGLFY